MNGVDLEVGITGEGPPVMFIHGFPLDHTMWEAQTSGLTRWRCIAPDLPGMGTSEVPRGPRSMADYAGDLAALLDVLGERRAVLVGLSMGGYVAFEFARRWPDRIAGLVLMHTRAEADTPEGRQGRDAMVNAVRRKGAVTVAEAMLPKLFAPETGRRSPGLVDRVRRMIEAMPVEGLVGALTAMRDRRDQTALLSDLGLWPVLVLAGERDQVTPLEGMRRMAEAIPGAGFGVIPGAGHLSPLERPREVTEALRGFLGAMGRASR